MKAIRTRYIGPTNTKPSRIVASDSDGNKVTVSYDSEYNVDEAMRLAAVKLMGKMKWDHEIVGGGYGPDMFWVMLPR